MVVPFRTRLTNDQRLYQTAFGAPSFAFVRFLSATKTKTAILTDKTAVFLQFKIILLVVRNITREYFGGKPIAHFTPTSSSRGAAGDVGIFLWAKYPTDKSLIKRLPRSRCSLAMTQKKDSLLITHCSFSLRHPEEPQATWGSFYGRSIPHDKSQIKRLPRSRCSLAMTQKKDSLLITHYSLLIAHYSSLIPIEHTPPPLRGTSPNLGEEFFGSPIKRCPIRSKMNFCILEEQILCQRRLGRMGCTCRTAHSAQARRCKMCPIKSKIT